MLHTSRLQLILLHLMYYIRIRLQHILLNKYIIRITFRFHTIRAAPQGLPLEGLDPQRRGCRTERRGRPRPPGDGVRSSGGGRPRLRPLHVILPRMVVLHFRDIAPSVVRYNGGDGFDGGCGRQPGIPDPIPSIGRSRGRSHGWQCDQCVGEWFMGVQ